MIKSKIKIKFYYLILNFISTEFFFVSINLKQGNKNFNWRMGWNSFSQYFITDGMPKFEINKKGGYYPLCDEA